jgi:hypothetical protein
VTLDLVDSWRSRRERCKRLPVVGVNEFDRETELRKDDRMAGLVYADDPLEIRIMGASPGGDDVGYVGSRDLPLARPRQAASLPGYLSDFRWRQASAIPSRSIEAAERANVIRQDPLEIGDRRAWNRNMAIKTARPQKRGVNARGVIRGPNDDDAGSRLGAVEFCQEGIDNDVKPPAVVTALSARADRIDLVDEDKAGSLLSRVGKCFLD